MQRSINHHYIPQYYLKGFTNEEKLFYLYDVKRELIDKNLHSTKSVFFEKNRNTILYKGMISDIIEKWYADFDDLGAILFQEIENSVAEEELFEPKILVAIKQFIALFLCRLPVIDNDIDFIIHNLDYSKTRNIITIDDKNTLSMEKTKKLLENDRNFRYFFRCFILPILIFDFKSEDNGRWYLVKAEEQVNHHVCCDIPILIKNYDLQSLLSFNTDFIFPLTNNKLLIHSMKKDICIEKLSPYFFIEVDMLLFWKAQKYVVCSDKEYLQHLIELKMESEKGCISFDEINTHVFDMLQNT